MKKHVFVCFVLLQVLLPGSCSNSKEEHLAASPATTQKIVSLNGSITEILCLAGQEKNIVGVDVTSTYPASLQDVPRVGHTRNLQAEGVLSLNPTLVLGREDDLQPAFVGQLKQAGITVVLFRQEYTAEGTKQFISDVCKAIGEPEKAGKISEQVSTDMAAIRPLTMKPKVLFIYARGAGTLMVAGNNTPMKTMIELAGGESAAQGFDDFKPLTPEALTEANPDMILMFSSGIESIEGEAGLLKIPGVAQTNAGRNKHFISMDGQLLSGFGPRLGQALTMLNRQFKTWADEQATAKK